MEQPTIKMLNKHYPKDGDIKKLIAYISGNSEKKDNQSVTYVGVAGISRKHEKAARQILKTQQAFGKEKGRRIYHMVVSFPKKIKDPQTAEQAAKAIAEEILKKYQVFYGVHNDTQHLHIHFAINAVSYADGRKWHMSKPELQKFKEYLLQLISSSIINDESSCN